MTGAMYAAIAGLKTHMSNLNVIGNNIANVNTNSYKAQRSVFRSSLYTSLSGGSNGTTSTGGMNPSQIGYGVNLDTVDIDMSTGNFNLTGRSLDCMIDGDAFFLVGDKTVANTIDPMNPESFKSLTLTRVGNFDFMADGYLCDNNGNTVYGFACVGTDADGNPVMSDQLVPLRLPKMITNANGSVTIIYPGSISADANADDVDDNGGRLMDATSVTTDEDGNITGINRGEPVSTLKNAVFTSTSIDSATGKITGFTSDNQPVTIGYIAMGTVTNPNGVTMESDSYYRCGDGAGELNVTLLGGAAKDIIVTSDPSLGNYRGNSLAPGEDDADIDRGTLTKGLLYVNGFWAQTYYAGDGAGNAGGDADGGPTITVDENGVVTGATGLSERAKVADGGTRRKLIPGGLESSKTDLATEISNMITTQRGYQANTRIVTVTDSMLEELVNMKR